MSIHDEAAARAAWCPFARVYETTRENRPASVNRDFEDGGGHPDCRCLASGCMAWRWSELPRAEDSRGLGRRGFCGLAGRPGLSA